MSEPTVLPPLTKMQALNYEVSASSWWVKYIGWDWGQELAGRYLAWKVKRKYARYLQQQADRELYLKWKKEDENGDSSDRS